MNKVLLMGRVTKDFELTQGAGKTRATNTIAINGYNDTVDFIHIVAFGETANALSKYVLKGHRLLIDGSIKAYNYTDKKTKENKTYTYVLVNSFEFIESKKAIDIPQDDDDDLPFN